MPPRPVQILLVLSLCGLTSLAQKSSRIPDDTIAEVGAGIITARDLFERIELMPWEGKDRRRTFDSSMVHALESLVAERLLASEAAERGIGFDTLMLLRLGGLEREFARDELYRREVAGGVSVSPGEMKTGLRKYALLLRVLVLRCSSELTGRKLSESMRAPSTPEGAAPPGSGEGVFSRDTVMVEFGIADESLEEHAYALDPAHPVSAPYHSENLGWVVLLLLDAQTDTRYAQQDVSKQLASVREILRSRKARIRGREFMRAVLSPQRAEADRELLGLLAGSIYKIIMSDTAAHRSRGRFLLAPEEVDILESDLRPDLARALVSTAGAPLSLGMAIQAFRIEPFSSPSMGRNTFLSVLNESVKRIVEEEFLAREAYRLHLENTPSVKHDLAAWSDNWRALMMEQSIPGGEPGEGGMTPDSLRSRVRPGIREGKRRHVIDRFIAGLAQKYGVKMYYDRLQKIDISRHNMFTRRLIGFGGMMNAAPLLKPEWGWVREYFRANHQVP